MLHDIIYRAPDVDNAEPTRLLPYDFLRKYIPLSLDVEDTFSLKYHTPLDNNDLTPRRVFYLDDIECYLVVDLGQPRFAGGQWDYGQVVLYLVDGKTHEIKCSYTYLVENYINYKIHDQIVDVCVHHSDMQNHVTVTFLLINNERRSSTVATYNLEYRKMGQPHNEEDASPIFYLELQDLIHFADVIPPGKADEIALGFEIKDVSITGGKKEYPEFLVNTLIPTLKTRLFVGSFAPKYCNITCDDKGRFIILIGTSINVYMGPFLSFPIDAQYIVMMDQGGMNIKFTLLSPGENAISFDESQTNQPYKYSLSVWDGRYLLCLEDRKCRYLSPQLEYVGGATTGDADHWLHSDADHEWEGGTIADHYYPMRKHTGTTVGYCTQWDSTSYLFPYYRETVWVTVNICDLLEEIEPEPVELPPEPPYYADIIFLIDDSSSMGHAIQQVKDNVGVLADRLNDLGFNSTDTHYGAMVFQNNTYQCVTSANDSLVTISNVGVLLTDIVASDLDAVPEVMSLSQKARGLTSKALRESKLNSVVDESTATAVAPYNLYFFTDPWLAVDNVPSKYALRDDALRIVILVTDTHDEIQNPLKIQSWKANLEAMSVEQQTLAKKLVPQSSHTQLTALETVKNHNLILCAVTPKAVKQVYDPVIQASGGTWINMSGEWGPDMALQIASLLMDKRDKSQAVSASDWWSFIAAQWGPAIYYNYTPALDFDNNSLVTIFHDDISFMVNGAIVRNRVNWLSCYDNYPQLGGEAQDSFYLPSLIPNETTAQLFVVRNESYTGTMKKIQLELIDKPADVEVEIKGFPEELLPRQLAAITVIATYAPQDNTSAPPERHLNIHYNMSYWMTHAMSCLTAYNEDEVDIGEGIYVPTKNSEAELYFVESNQAGNFSPGTVKSISFDPLYTLAYVTTTDYKEDDLTEQETWSDRLYILEKDTVNSAKFERISPVPITSIVGYDTATTGCCWLRVRGPVVWTTTRTYECRTNTKTWYLVNQSTTRTYVAHPVLDENTAPDHQEMGFILFEYPEGNIIPPGESRPVTMKWQPIFKPDGEDMTRRTTYPAVRDCQDDAVRSIWSTEDGFFNNILYSMAVGHINSDTGEYTVYPDYGTKFTHTYIERIFGDGMDIPVRPDQPLHKMDVKQLNGSPYLYKTLTYFDVDVNQVADNFQFLTRAGIWMGVKDDPDANDVPLPLGAKPSDMFDYVEWISPASGLEEVPQYIDHKFKVNPLYTFNGDTAYPYQLAPFNKEYAKPYVATLFMGQDTIKTKDIACSSYVSWNQYIDQDANIVPCDSAGNEQAGWLIQNFWPVSNDRDLSVSRLATENDYIFTKTFYAKNKDTVNPHQIVLDYDANVLNGVSVQGVDVTTNGLCPPGGIASIDVSFRLHYTYQEAKCVNLVKDILYIPVFLE